MSPPPLVSHKRKNKQNMEKGSKSCKGFHQERCGKVGGGGFWVKNAIFIWGGGEVLSLFSFFLRSFGVRFCGCGGAVTVYVSCDDGTE